MTFTPLVSEPSGLSIYYQDLIIKENKLQYTDNNKTKFYRYYLPAILWAIVIFIGSSIPSSSLPKFAIKVKDLILHFIEYSIFGVLLAHSIIKKPDRLTFKTGAIVLLIGIIYGISDEFHQKFVPGRLASVHDVIADSVGVVFGLILYRFFPRKSIWNNSRNE